MKHTFNVDRETKKNGNFTSNWAVTPVQPLQIDCFYGENSKQVAKEI